MDCGEGAITERYGVGVQWGYDMISSGVIGGSVRVWYGPQRVLSFPM